MSFRRTCVVNENFSHKILLPGPWQNAQPSNVPVNIYLYFHLLNSVGPKTIQVCICGDENTFPPLEDLQILGMPSTSHITSHTTLSNEWCLKLLLGVCNIVERGDLSISPDTPRQLTHRQYLPPSPLFLSLSYLGVWQVKALSILACKLGVAEPIIA